MIGTAGNKGYQADEVITRKLSDDEYTTQLMKGFSQDTAAMQDNTVRLAQMVRDAILFLDGSSHRIQKDWLDARDVVNQAVTEMRQARHALEFECRHVLTAAADVRKFFLDDRHELEVKRLREFCDLCAQLKAYKADGTLDAVADTILKLECKQDSTT